MERKSEDEPKTGKKNGNEVVHFCAFCESIHAAMRCAGCRMAWYCGGECQILHWKKGGHKEECQALLQSGAEEAQRNRSTNVTGCAEEEPADFCSDGVSTTDCMICLAPPEKPSKLPCGHEFCSSCVADLRTHGVQQACPLCREALPPSAKRLYEQAMRLYVQILCQVSRGMFVWPP